jgi:hypothetical protein
MNPSAVPVHSTSFNYKIEDIKWWCKPVYKSTIRWCGTSVSMSNGIVKRCQHDSWAQCRSWWVECEAWYWNMRCVIGCMGGGLAPLLQRHRLPYPYAALSVVIIDDIGGDTKAWNNDTIRTSARTTEPWVGLATVACIRRMYGAIWRVPSPYRSYLRWNKTVSNIRMADDRP